jgi:hypothetical protein
MKSSANQSRTCSIGRSVDTQGGRCFKYRPPGWYLRYRPPRGIARLPSPPHAAARPSAGESCRPLDHMFLLLETLAPASSCALSQWRLPLQFTPAAGSWARTRAHRHCARSRATASDQRGLGTHTSTAQLALHCSHWLLSPGSRLRNWCSSVRGRRNRRRGLLPAGF